MNSSVVRIVLAKNISLAAVTGYQLQGPTSLSSQSYSKILCRYGLRYKMALSITSENKVYLYGFFHVDLSPTL